MSLPSTPPTGERVEGIPAPPGWIDPDPTESIPPETEPASAAEMSVTSVSQLWEAATPSRASRIMRAVLVVSVAILALLGVVRLFAPRATPEAATVDLPQ